MREEHRANEFERLLNEKTERFDLKPSQEVWQNVQAAIQQNRRRRFAWWLMAAGLFALLSIGALLVLQNKSPQSSTFSKAENSSDRNTTTTSTSSSEKNRAEENVSSANNNDHISTAQNQSDKNTQSKKSDENLVTGEKENKKSVIVSASISGNESIDKDQDEETMTLLPSKEFAFGTTQNSIHQVFFEQTSIEFSSAPPSNHSFYFEADAMPLMTFVWNHTIASPLSLSLTDPSLPLSDNSSSFAKGFSAGGNFLLEENKIWLFGLGMHYTKTHLEAIVSQQTIPLYDTSYVFDGYAFVPQLTTIGDTIVYQSQHNINQWLDVSLMAGVKLFPSSKNHLRIVAGAGYSRLLAEDYSQTTTPAAYDALSGSTHTSTTNVAPQVYSYQKNQLQLFSEISYQRDLTPVLSLTAGLGAHYYPMNLFNSDDLSQHMMWLGLKGGLVFRL